MNIKLNKENLTAYVLGELDEAERVEVEKALAGDEQARKQVDQIRAAAEITRELFAAGPELSLSENQRETIASQAAAAEEDEGAEVVSLHPEPTPRLHGWPLLRAAAVFLMVIGTGAIIFYPMYEHGREPESMSAKSKHFIVKRGGGEVRTGAEIRSF